MSSGIVRKTMIGAIQIIRDRLEAIDSPVLSQNISEDEYIKYYRDLFIEYGVAHIENEILEDTYV